MKYAPWILVIALLGVCVGQYVQSAKHDDEVKKLQELLAANIVIVRDDLQLTVELRKMGFDLDRIDLFDNMNEAELRRHLRAVSSAFSHSTELRTGILQPYAKEEIKKRGEVPPSDRARSDVL